MKDIFMCLLALAAIGMGYVALDQREAYLAERRDCERLQDRLQKRERMIKAQAEQLAKRPVIWKKKVIYKELP